ncbi:unnamed protein product [Chilo suppressalis]|uniref:Serpin domain-containing protein n=1 Tax=Chilo suppressalis TaxID=168631 RepID=A0ABN8LC39_CHISP|nr:unnamed protein product [Chilo suppressalis]
MCIPSDKCPSCGGDENAVIGCGSNCGKKCTDLVDPRPVCALGCILNGCDCRNGFYYDSNTKKCVSPDQCTDGCPDGEEYSACPEASCYPLTCSEVGYPKPDCGNTSLCLCKPACICKSGDVRDASGMCIPSDKCPSCGGDENAVIGCGSNCGKKCTDLVDPRPVCPLGCILNGCDCRDGFYYDSNTKKCVSPDQCTDNCPDGEEYSACPEASCNPVTCSEVGFPKANCGDTSLSSCKPACICKDGNIRDESGKCIPSNECPSCGGDENAVPGCGINCGKQCSDLIEPKNFCILVCLVNACDCKEGFYYDNTTKKCVKPEDCTYDNCPVDEEFSGCPEASCNPLTCDEVGFPKPDCVDSSIKTCKPACICKNGYVRDQSGKCIPSNQCPSCGGDENAEPGCGINCRKQCSDLVDPKNICILRCKLNACDCKKGFYFDSNTNRCVSPDQCTSTCSGPNEVYDQCPDCSPQTCATRNKIYDCPLNTESGPNCKPACRCITGYFRNSKGICVPRNECETPRCPFGEYYSDCPPIPCDAEFCPRNRNSPQTCAVPKICGKARCLCGFNQKRDRSTGRCIPIRNCPPFACYGRNEIYDSCPPVCPGQTCTDYLRNATCPRYRIGIVVPCKPACRCRKGYYRNHRGCCVRARRCEQTSINTSQQLPNQSNQNSCNNLANQQLAFEYGANTFTMKFLYQLVKANPEISVISSAASVLIPLAELALYSQGSTYTEIMNVLNLTTKEEIRCVFKTFLDAFKANEGTELDFANKIYVAEKYNLSESFQQDISTVFNGEAESINFDKPYQAAATVNQWVSDKTKEKITNLVAPDMFDSMTRLLLANAVFFKGIWKTKFDSNKTQPMAFYVNANKTIQVEMMQLKTKMNYINNDNLDAQFIELPYLDGNITLLVAVPNQKFGLMDLIKNLQNPTVLDALLNSLILETVTLYLPKIDVSTSINLKNILSSIGVGTVFTSSAELSGMTVPNADLYVSQAVQKATITINEEGSIAAAANGLVGTALAATVGPREYIVRADHPYAYFIKVRNILLFSGAYCG